MIELVLSVALSVGVSGDLALALLEVENTPMDPYAVSKTDDIGLFQLHRKYIPYFLDLYWDRDDTFVVFNPEHNTFVALSHLKKLLDTHQNTWQALVAYNCGEGAVKSGRVPSSSVDYANKILEKYQSKRAVYRR